MRFYFDESGDFSFSANGFDAYTQAVVICPDSKLADVEGYVTERRSAWDVAELHGVDLSDDQVWEVCRFMRAQRLPALVQATDTTAATLKEIETHRLTQAARLQENLQAWRSAGGTGEEIPHWYEQQIWRTAHPGKIPHSEWVQTDLLIDLFHRAINKAIVFYVDDKWRADFEQFRFILDGKLPGKLARGEKHLDKILLGFLASNPDRIQIIGVTEWTKPPVHPFHANFSAENGNIDLRKLFAFGLEFEPSHEHAGLQLADVLAYTARRRIVQPDNETIRHAWQTVKPIVRTHHGRYLYLRRFSTGGDNADLDHYRGVQTDR